MNVGRAALAGATSLLLSCGGGGGTAPPAGARDLGGAIAAKVGGEEIPVASVARVAAAQHVDARRARDLLVTDAVLAAGARQRGIDPWYQADTLLARRLSASVLAEAVARGPVTDAELEEGTKRYWLDVDRPAGKRVAQVVVLLPSDAPAETKAAAQHFADQIRDKAVALRELAERTVPPAVSFHEPLGAQLDDLAQAFAAASNQVPRGNLQAQFEVDSPISDDDRMLDPQSQGVVHEFTVALHEVHERGDVHVFSTRFGVHVVLLLENTPAALYTPEERRRKLLDVVIKDRARAAEAELLAKLRAKATIERSADAVLADVVVAP